MTPDWEANDGDTIEVPVTRTAKTALIGRASCVQSTGLFIEGLGAADLVRVLAPGQKLVTRPRHQSGYPFRSGMITVGALLDDAIIATTTTIPALADRDYVYLVED